MDKFNELLFLNKMKFKNKMLKKLNRIDSSYYFIKLIDKMTFSSLKEKEDVKKILIEIYETEKSGIENLEKIYRKNLIIPENIKRKKIWIWIQMYIYKKRCKKIIRSKKRLVRIYERRIKRM